LTVQHSYALTVIVMDRKPWGAHSEQKSNSIGAGLANDRYAPGSDKIPHRNEMTRCTNNGLVPQQSGCRMSTRVLASDATDVVERVANPSPPRARTEGLRGKIERAPVLAPEPIRSAKSPKMASVISIWRQPVRPS